MSDDDAASWVVLLHTRSHLTNSCYCARAVSLKHNLILPRADVMHWHWLAVYLLSRQQMKWSTEY
mgnify:CR=1 FL=1